MSNSDARISAERLASAIRANGWTYAVAAKQVRKHLPEDTRFSSVSLWSYATGRTIPRRTSYIEAIEAAFDVPPNGLSGDDDTRERSPGRQTPVGAPETASRSTVLYDTGDGRMRLKIDMVVSWQTALKIFSILKQTETADADSSSDGADDPDHAVPARLSGTASD
jgi:hypothetical protein